MAEMKFVVAKGSVYYDMTELVLSVKWSGRRGAAARSLKVELLDQEGHGLERSNIDCEEGNFCIFSWKDKEIFRGIIMSHSYQGRRLSVTAYDAGIYLSNNKDTFQYENQTAAQIFRDCVKRLKLELGTVAETGHVIPELPKPRTTHFDVICDALSQTYQATGMRYYPIAMGGKLSLLKRKENTLQWVLETGNNILNCSYSKSIEDTKTTIRLLSEKGTVLAEKSNAALEKKIGIFQEVDTPEDTLNQAQLDELAAEMLKERGSAQQTLQIEALGIPDAYSGKCIYIIAKELGLDRFFFIEEDSHTFKGRYHSMSLNLNFTSDIADIE